MQFPSVNHASTLWPVSGAAPVAPTRAVLAAYDHSSASGSTSDNAAVEGASGVVNHINPSVQGVMPSTPNEGQPVYTSVPDPVKNSASSRQVPHDWSVHSPASESVETPPAAPVSQVVTNQAKTVWTSSASPVQLAQVYQQLNPPVQTLPAQPNGVVAQQALVYQPGKVTGTTTVV